MRFLRGALAIAIFLLALSGAASATTITITSTTIGGWRYAATAPQLRIYLNKAITTSDGKILQPGSTQTSNSFYQTVTCSVAANVLTIPQFPLDSTTDALVGNDATYSGYFYASGATGAAQIGPYQGFTKFALSPLPVSTTWSLILQFNNTFIPHRDPFTYSREQIDFKLQQASGVPLSRVITTTSPLTGGGGLSGDLTIALPKATGSVNGYLAATDFTIFSAKQAGPLTGDVTTSGAAATLANNAVSDAKLRDSAALSVIGRAANSSGDPGDIAAGIDGQVLRRSGTSLGFSLLVNANIDPAAAIAYPKLNLAGAVVDSDIVSITTRAKMPSALAYEDEANSYGLLQTFGTGTHTGGGIFTPVSTPEFVSIASGTSAAPSTNVAPALTVTKIWNGNAQGGVGLCATFYGTHAGNTSSAVEMVSIWARQIVAGTMHGLYVRGVGEIGGAGQSHFASAFSWEQDITNVDRTVTEFNPSNQTGTDASQAYGTVGNRSNGIGVVAVGSNKHTLAMYIDTQGGAPGNFYTGIDFRPNSIDTATLGGQSIRIPNATYYGSWNAANSAFIPLIGLNSSDVVWLDKGGQGIQAGTGSKQLTDATGAFAAVLDGCRVYNSANVSLANGFNTVTFDSERYDDGGLHSTSSNTSRITIARTGKYYISGSAAMAGSALGAQRILRVQLNGVTFIASQEIVTLGGASQPELTVGTVYKLTAGDYVELVAFQDTGGALNLLALPNYSAEFSVQYLSQ